MIFPLRIRHLPSDELRPVVYCIFDRLHFVDPIDAELVDELVHHERAVLLPRWIELIVDLVDFPGAPRHFPAGHGLVDGLRIDGHRLGRRSCSERADAQTNQPCDDRRASRDPLRAFERHPSHVTPGFLPHRCCPAGWCWHLHRVHRGDEHVAHVSHAGRRDHVNATFETARATRQERHHLVAQCELGTPLLTPVPPSFR